MSVSCVVAHALFSCIYSSSLARSWAQFRTHGAWHNTCTDLYYYTRMTTAVSGHLAAARHRSCSRKLLPFHHRAVCDTLTLGWGAPRERIRPGSTGYARPSVVYGDWRDSAGDEHCDDDPGAPTGWGVAPSVNTPWQPAGQPYGPIVPPNYPPHQPHYGPPPPPPNFPPHQPHYGPHLPPNYPPHQGAPLWGMPQKD
eukprot:COSAG05_NODE_2187_length_3425_cov_3.315995_3_plen_197_part_00